MEVETEISCAAAVRAGSAIPQMDAATAGFCQTKAERELYLSWGGIVLRRGIVQCALTVWACITTESASLDTEINLNYWKIPQSGVIDSTIITWRNISETYAVKNCLSYTQIKIWEARAFQYTRYSGFLQRWLSLSSQGIIFCPKARVIVGVSTKNCCNLWYQHNPKTAGDDPLHVCI